MELIAGGISGLLGTAISSGLAYFKARQRHEQELEMRQLDLEEIRLEAETAEKRAAIELEARQSEADAKIMDASYREASSAWTQGMALTGKQTWPIIIVDFVRGLMRPLLTLSLVWITYQLWSGLPADDTLRTDIVNAMVYITTTAVLWWFGSRQVEKYVRRG